ncbi:MAG: adenylosuccinate lyase [Sinobacteraceae bacterium]|nr:adenylosuccinate lyase [Nevskiaceae bacterium]
MTAPSRDTLPALEALSPVDGRYRAATAALRPILSEAGLIRERIRVEARWLLHLAAAAPQLAGASLLPAVRERAETLIHEPPAEAAQAVKQLESQINHDVKAVEYYVRQQLQAAGAVEATLELVHFGCTSEDINNLAYALMMQRARGKLLEILQERRTDLVAFARRYADQPMLARTHGQPASPTTLGKEFANVAARLQAAAHRFRAQPILGKWNGAVGNFNAHVAALPDVDWLRVGCAFVESLGLECNRYTTQIEPHDWLAAYCDALAAINVILIDLCRDCWGYISLGYLRQRAVAGEVGSSTMPHKINPIDFENAEGNLGVANALLRHFSDKLPISRWQRDLTDSTVLRNVGVALGHSLIAWRALGRGLQKVAADPVRLDADVGNAWEVLGEAVQTVLRASGAPGGYERLKDFTRGRAIDAATLQQFIDTLPLPAAERERLKALRPETYVGLAATLARQIGD